MMRQWRQVVSKASQIIITLAFISLPLPYLSGTATFTHTVAAKSADSVLSAAYTAFDRGEHKEVVKLLRQRLLQINLNSGGEIENAKWLNILAESCEVIRDTDCASQAYQHNINLHDHNGAQPPITALNGLGLILSRRGQHATAVGLMRRACELSPDNHGLWNNFGTVAHTQGDADSVSLAMSSYRRAWQLSKQKVKVYGYNYGNALMDGGRHLKAIKILKKTSRLDKNFAEVWWKLGRCYVALGRFKKAVRAFRKAIKFVHSARKFNEADIQFELHDALLAIQPNAMYDEAVDALERAVHLTSHKPEYMFALSHLYRYTANYQGLERMQREGILKKILENELGKAKKVRPSLSPMRGLTFLDSTKMLMLMDGWARSLSKSISHQAHASPSQPYWTDSGKQLRAGFISSEWEKNSPVMHLVDRLPLLMAQHGSKVASTSTIFVYNLGPSNLPAYPGATTLTELRTAGVIIRSLHGVTDAEAARIIASDKLHIIIDLTGYTAGGRPEILAHLNGMPKAASLLRMSYLGWPSTMGSTDVIDITIGDKIVTPAETAFTYYAEKLVYMPGSFFLGDHVHKMQRSPVSLNGNSLDDVKASERSSLMASSFPRIKKSPVEMARTAFIFANFNQLFKLDDLSQLDVWANILRRATGKHHRSFLWLLRHPAVAEPRVLNQLRARGIQTQLRIIFSDFVQKDEYLVRSSAADLFLDNFQYNAGATGVDALFSRVPVLTMPTERTVGRMGKSMASDAYSYKDDKNDKIGGGAGMGATILTPTNSKAYEDIAVRISKSKRLLRHLRSKLGAKERTYLFDPVTWSCGFRNALKCVSETRGKSHIVVGRAV